MVNYLRPIGPTIYSFHSHVIVINLLCGGKLRDTSFHTKLVLFSNFGCDDAGLFDLLGVAVVNSGLLISIRLELMQWHTSRFDQIGVA